MLICKLYKLCPYRSSCPHAIEHENCKMKSDSNCYGNCTIEHTTKYIRKQKLKLLNDKIKNNIL